MALINSPIWEPRLPLPALAGDVTADVCVIGLGGSGLACIHELLAAGRRVVGVDAVGIAGGAAGRNGGFLLGGLAMFHHAAVERFGRMTARSIYEETLKQIDRMADETPAAVWRTGTLRIATSPEEIADCARQLAAMLSDGLPVEWYEGREGKGLLFPADAAFDPAARCAALARDALARGAQLFGDATIIAIEGNVATSTAGSVSAAHFVVAVDGRLEAILPELSPRVRSARLQMLATDAIPPTFPRPVYARWGLDYWQQRIDGRIVLGGCRDVGGDAEWTTSAEPTEDVQAALTKLLREQLHIDADVTHRWAATVGYTTTGMPVLEQVRPGVWAIGAYSGTGNVIGALCGRAVAELIVRGKSEIAALLTA